MLLVVPFHVGFELPESYLPDLFNEVAGGVRMPLLLFICGLLAERSSRSIERLVQFGWLFAIWSVLLCVANAFAKGVVLTPTALLYEIIHPTTPLWFVWAIAIMTVSLRLCRRQPLFTLSFAAAISIIVEATTPFASTSFAYNQILSKAVFFYLGVFTGWRLFAWVEGRGHATLWLVPALIGLRILDHFSVQQFGWQVLGLAERLVAICLALYLARQVHRLPIVGSLLHSTGQNTLPIYVGHGLFIPLGVWLFGALAPVPLAFACVTVFTVAGSMALSRAAQALEMPWLYKVPDAVIDALRASSLRLRPS